MKRWAQSRLWMATIAAVVLVACGPDKATTDPFAGSAASPGGAGTPGTGAITPAARDASIDAPRDAPQPPPLPVQLPEAPGGTEPEDDTAPLLIVSRDAITYDGVELVTLQDGKLAAGDVQRTGSVTKLGRALAARLPPPRRVRVAFDAAVSGAVANAVIETVRRALVQRADVLVQSGGSRRALPLELPAVGRRIGVPELVLGVSGDTLVVWSRSGRFGTRASPRLETTVAGGLGQLTKELIAIRAVIERGDPGGALPLLGMQLDPASDVGTLARVAGTARLAYPRVALAGDLK